MLTSIILGQNQKKINNNWEIVKDEYDNTYLSNKSIRQRIRIGKKVEPFLEEVKSDSQYAVYEISKNTYISNNNKNMNLSLMNFWSKNGEAKADDSIMYITFSNEDYKLLSYSSCGHEIVQTWKNNNICQGLAIKYTGNDQNIFIMTALDLHTKEYVSITVYSDAGDTPIININPLSKTELESAKNLYKKYENRAIHFGIHLKSLPTSTFIVDSKYTEDVERAAGKIQNSNVIVLADGKDLTENTHDQAYLDSLDNTFKKAIVENRIRALTTVGVRIPRNFCKKYNILYLFSYNTSTGIVKCIKSN